MIPPPPSINEADRLADVRALQLLDTPHEMRFDRIVRLCRQIFGVSIAYIALIDSDRQWFKSKCGVPADQTPRDTSFCGHTILQDSPLIIPDATEDERFHDNPMVAGDPFIKFYAGWPLKGPAGHNVATLCLADQVAQDFTPEQMAIFKTLAEQAEHELNVLDVIHAQRELIATQQALVLTQQQLAGELNEAADFVLSQLPTPITDGAVRANHRFISSSQLGGDIFGYHRIDEDHTAAYLLDVTGHGVGASLLATTVARALSPTGQFKANLSDPADVLNALNRAFRFEENNNKFFTIWYAVIDHKTRELHSAVGGHHPAVAVYPDDTVRHIGEPALIVGVDSSTRYVTTTTKLEPGTRIYVFSDGAFEIKNADKRMLGFDGITNLIYANALSHPSDTPDAVIHQLRAYQGQDRFTDDLSLVELQVA